MFTAASGLVLGLLGWLLLGYLAGGILLVVGLMIPYMIVRQKMLSRQETLRGQLPDAFDLMARALRAGQTMAQSMQSVADELGGPITYDFTVCYEQQNLGLPPDEALRDLSRRTGLMELNIFAVAVVVQRQVGGNLAEMLEKLAHLIRERFRIRGLIQTLTAEGRLQAVVLMGLPPLILLIMFVLNPDYAMDFFRHPILLVLIVLGDGIAGLWIRKIVNFDF
jgi:tight adherence protein B